MAKEKKASYLQAAKSVPPWSRHTAEPSMADVGKKTLRGLPGSPGRASGPVCRVRGPEDFARFPNGAVLVARTTNPAWTPLFYAASAVITESGGPLSHGAVTAREMGLPAVMAVRGVMETLIDGQGVSVDGAAGVVEIDADQRARS
jgi:pyruvate,water dikinase